MTGVQSMLDAIRNAFTLAGGTPGLSALFLAGLIALWYGKSRQKKDTALLFQYALVVLLLIISPPYLFLVGRFFRGYTIDYMYLWLLPLTPVLLKVFSDTAVVVKAAKHRVIFVLSAAALLLLAGTSSFQPESWRLVENHDYIPRETLCELEEIKRLRQEQGRESLLFWGPDDLMEYARDYDGGLQVVYGEDLWMGSPDTEMHQIYTEGDLEAWRIMQEAPDHLAGLGMMAKGYGCDLVILPKSLFYERQQPWPRLIGRMLPEEAEASGMSLWSGEYVLQETTEKNIIYIRR